MIEWLGFMLLMFIIGQPLFKQVLGFLQDHRLVGENYKGQAIPVGTGLYLWLMALTGWFAFKLLVGTGFFMAAAWMDSGLLLHFILALTIVFIAGWMDDVIGDRKVKGFRGHVLQWVKKGTVTTGLLKAVITAVVTLWVVMSFSASIGLAVVQFLILTLSTNMVNLLDLRPGRACKSFVAVSIIIMLIGSWQHACLFLLPLLLGVFIVLPNDLNAQSMLGDAGANILGFALGWSIVFATPVWLQLIVLVGLLILHWIAERKSITAIIESNRLLHWIDQLGRV